MKEVKHHVYVKRETQICTTWPSLTLSCCLMSIISTLELVVSCNFLSIRIVLSGFYLLILYFEKLSVNLNLTLGCVQTDATLLANKSQHCWMLHVTSVCTPCCILLDVVACCWAKFEIGHTFSPVQTDASLLANKSQHCWMLHVTSVCTPCCILLDVVACCWAKFEIGHTFSPMQTDASLLANNS